MGEDLGCGLLAALGMVCLTLAIIFAPTTTIILIVILEILIASGG